MLYRMWHEKVEWVLKDLSDPNIVVLSVDDKLVRVKAS